MRVCRKKRLFRKIIIITISAILSSLIYAAEEPVLHYSFDNELDKGTGIITDNSGNNQGVFNENTRLLMRFDEGEVHDGVVEDKSSYGNDGALIAVGIEDKIYIRDSSGNAVASFGTSTGNLALKGVLETNPSYTATGSDEFRFQDSSGNDVMIIDMTNGNMYIDGPYFEAYSGALTPSPNDFVIKDNSGNVVSYVSETGELFLKGTLTQNANNAVLEGGVNCNVEGISGKGCGFDGVSGYVDVGKDDNVFPNTVLTWEVWIKPESCPANGVILWDDDDQGGGDRGIEIRNDCKVYAGDGFNDVSSSEISLGSWHHIAFTSGNGKRILYLNGEKVNEAADNLPEHSGRSYVSIGSGHGGYRGYFKGLIDEVAIYSKALSQEEIKQHYEAKKAEFTDWTTGKSGQGLEFDGVDDKVIITDSTSLNPTNTFSVEAWIKPNIISTSQYNEIVTFHQGGIQFRVEPSTSKIRLWILSGSWNPAEGTTIIPTNTWTHVVGTFDGSTMRVYVNGVLEGTGSSGAAQAWISNVATMIGDHPAGNHRFNGIIDEVKIYDHALTEDEIKENFNFVINPPKPKRATGFKPNLVTILMIISILSLLAVYDVNMKLKEVDKK